MRLRVLGVLIINVLAWVNGYALANSEGIRTQQEILSNVGPTISTFEMFWAIPVIQTMLILPSFLYLAWAYDPVAFWPALKAMPSDYKAMIMDLVHSLTRNKVAPAE